MGTCVYHIAHRGIGQTLGDRVRTWSCRTSLRRSTKRENWHERMQDEATRLSAYGHRGVRLEEKSHQWVRTPSIPLTRHRRLKTRRVTLAKPTTIITLDN